MKVSAAQLVVRALNEENIRFVFGIPGTHNIELYDALIDAQNITPILVTDEQCAPFMADGVSRVSGSMAAIAVVPGAGLTHAMSGIAECYMDNVPLLVLACGVRDDVTFAYQLHDIDQVSMVRPVCKKAFHPKTHEEVYQQIRTACSIAQQAPAGPVVVEVPANLYLQLKDVSKSDLQFNPVENLDMGPSSTLLEPILETLSQAKSIGIYAGMGAIGAQSLLIELTEKLDAIVFTTISGKGVFPEDHPRWAWNTMGAAAPKPIQKIEKKLDCLLAIGCKFGEVATASYGFSPPETLIHIDSDPRVFNRNYHAKHTLQADAKEASQALLTSTKLGKKEIDRERLRMLAQAHQLLEQNNKQQTPHQSDRVCPSIFIPALQKHFGQKAAYVTDSGNGTFLAMEHLRINYPNSFLAPVDYSCMGYSVPAAIGAKLAAPDRPVIALVGDGAFLMTGFELMTAKALNLGVVACILRDGELSQIAQFQKTTLNRKSCSDLPTFDFQAMSQTLGLKYLHIKHHDDIETCLKEAACVSQTGCPVLIEVNIDYSKPTHFTKGVIKTNFLRFPLKDRMRLIGRIIKRKISPGFDKHQQSTQQ